MSYYPTQVATAIPPATDFNLPPPAAVDGTWYEDLDAAKKTQLTVGVLIVAGVVVYSLTKKKGKRR